MPDNELKMPAKFSFDEFYEMLKELVNDSEARECLAVFDAEDAKGRGDLLDGSQCSDLAFDAYSDFTAAGWKVLAGHGWPTYGEVIKATNSSIRLDVMSCGNQLYKIGRRLIRKEPNQKGWDFQDGDFSIEDRESVFRLLEVWERKYGDPMPFDLRGDF